MSNKYITKDPTFRNFLIGFAIFCLLILAGIWGIKQIYSSNVDKDLTSQTDINNSNSGQEQTKSEEVIVVNEELSETEGASGNANSSGVITISDDDLKSDNKETKDSAKSQTNGLEDEKLDSGTSSNNLNSITKTGPESIFAKSLLLGGVVYIGTYILQKQK